MLRLIIIWTLLLIVASQEPIRKDKYTITTIVQAPFLTVDDEGDFEGYIPDMIGMLKTYLGVDFDVRLVADGKYGSPIENGTEWDGMIGELLRGEADMAVAPLTLTSSRSKVVDFSKPFMSIGITRMIKKPSRIDATADYFISFFTPLTAEVWLTHICICLIFIASLALVNNFHPGEKDTVRDAGACIKLIDAWWILGTTAYLQGYEQGMKTITAKVVKATWFGYVVLVLTLYVTTLIKSKAHARGGGPALPSLEDLGTQTRHRPTFIQGGSTETFFRESSVEDYEKIYALSQASNSIEEAVERVRTERYVFLGETPMINHLVGTDKDCDLMSYGQNLDSKGYSIATPPNSDLKDFITIALLEMRENGDLAKLEKKWFMGALKCGVDNVASAVTSDLAVPINLGRFASNIVLLSLGVVIALLVGLVELLIFKTNKSCYVEEN